MKPTIINLNIEKLIDTINIDSKSIDNTFITKIITDALIQAINNIESINNQ